MKSNLPPPTLHPRSETQAHRMVVGSRRRGASTFIGTVPLLIFSILPSPCVLAQNWPPRGLYEIVSGNYIECCGIAGEIRRPVPNPRQALVRLDFDGTLGASLAFLADDTQTVFRVTVCPPGNPIDFQFVHGLIFSNSIVFQADAGPPPNQYFYRYTVSNLADGLRIDGILATPPPQCPDIPGSFRHTNVQIRLSLPRPVIRDVHYDSGAIRFRFMGDAPYDYFVEFTESIEPRNWLSLTNFRAQSATIDVTVQDTVIPRHARFYRIRKQSCQCN